MVQTPARGDAPSAASRVMIGHARENRFVILLGVLVAFYLISPLIETVAPNRALLTSAFLIVVIAAINASREVRVSTMVAFAIGASTAAAWLARVLFESPFWEIVGNLFAVVLAGYTIWIVLRGILRQDAANFDIVSGAAAVYLLLGIAWACAYSLVDDLAPGAFKGIVDQPVMRWNGLLYFSLTTLTTLGYGDVLPVHPFARKLATLQAATGVLYIATLVARLVALYRR